MVHVAQDAATRNAIAFIERDPTIVAITPRHTTVTSSGGKRWVNDDELVPDEIVRTIPSVSTSAQQQPTRVTADGRTVLPSWMIVTRPLTNIKVGAILHDQDGRQYEIVYRSRVPSWRTVFEAIENG